MRAAEADELAIGAIERNADVDADEVIKVRREVVATAERRMGAAVRNDMLVECFANRAMYRMCTE